VVIFSMTNIIIADDHAVVRRGIIQILSESFPRANIVEVADAQSLLKRIFQESWDLVISDISMPGISGMEILLQIKQHYPKLPVLILSMYSEDVYAIRALKAGASGFLNKDFVPEQLVAAVNKLLSGKKYISANIAEKLVGTLDKTTYQLPHECLSNREFEVFKYIGAGQTVSDIAHRLSLSVTSISTYRARIISKMHLRTNADIIMYSIENNLL
jgi:two-component system, NarL family, invasion response regulator UvrY